jgi:hypothetical protein
MGLFTLTTPEDASLQGCVTEQGANGLVEGQFPANKTSTGHRQHRGR